MSTPYSTAYFPPAPVIEVRVGVPGEPPQVGPFEAFVDTGADATIVPKDLLLGLAAPSLFEAELHSPWGERHPVIIYLVDLQVGAVHLPGVQVAADEETEEIALGRNVLNKLPLFLDGPQQLTDLVDDPALQRLRARRSDV